MISWIKGEIIEYWEQGIKKGIVLDCNNIGYEIQLLPRHHIKTEPKTVFSIWIHQLFREEGITLFGFQEKIERDLFRKLIEISGIGPQIAISLLEEYKAYELIQTIKEEEITKLTKCNGVGKRIADRLIVELRNKLPEFTNEFDKEDFFSNNALKNNSLNPTLENELKTLLKELDYSELEIIDALKATSKKLMNKEKSILKDDFIDQNDLIGTYLKAALVWLNQDPSTKGT